MNNLVTSLLNRKIRPAHPGEIISDILDDYFIAREEFCQGNYQWIEILDGERPVTPLFIAEVNISTQLLINLQRKVDIWDSKHE